MTNTLYENLEVSPNASPQTIRAAYRSLSQRYHPDKNPSDTEAARRMQQINAAFQILSSPETRAAYDAELSRRQRANGPDGPPSTDKMPDEANPGGFLNRKFYSPLVLIAMIIALIAGGPTIIWVIHWLVSGR